MGLLRFATIIAVGVALLPSDREQQSKLYDRAGAAAHWTMTFCDRNAAVCQKGGELWTQFVAKAEFGAKLAYDMMRQNADGGGGGLGTGDSGGVSGDSAARAYAPAALERESSTLTPLDRRPAWRGKSASKGSI